MIDLESLRCFVAAAQRLNFRAAAKQVTLSPAAFSDRIQRLEQDLESTLFIRTTRRVQLSPQGEALLPQAIRTLAEAEKCHEAVQQEVEVNIQLGTRYELGLSYILPAITSFSPYKWRIHLVFGDSRTLTESLRKGEVDAVIGSMRLTAPKLEYMPLHKEEYRFVASPKLIEKFPLQTPSDAHNHTLIDISAAQPLFRYWLDQIPDKEAWSFGDAQYMGTIAANREWIINGYGVGILPEYFIRQDLQENRLTEVLPHIRPGTDWFRLIWPKSHPRREFFQQIGQKLREIPLR